MKTSNASLTILAKAPERAPIERDDIPILIRTEDGQLMGNRVRSLLKEYGERIWVPPTLMIEVLEDRNRKSRRLKSTQKRLHEYQCSYEEAVNLLLALHNAAATMQNAMIDAPGDNPIANITQEIEGLNNVLEITESFLNEVVTFDED